MKRNYSSLCEPYRFFFPTSEVLPNRLVMAYAFAKHFSLEEANELVPAIRKLFEHVFELIDPPDFSFGQGPAEESGANGNGNGHSNGNGHKIALSSLRPQDRVEAANELLRQVTEKGIVIQDWRRGLIDFPHIRTDGSEVFLCYELRDGTSINYFHEIDAGYAGRQPLDEL